MKVCLKFTENIYKILTFSLTQNHLYRNSFICSPLNVSTRRCWTLGQQEKDVSLAHIPYNCPCSVWLTSESFKAHGPSLRGGFCPSTSSRICHELPISYFSSFIQYINRKTLFFFNLSFKIYIVYFHRVAFNKTTTN